MAKKKEDTKVFQILSYIGILWLIGLFVKEKDDKDVKFHVGQGMILTIVYVGLSVVIGLLQNLVIYNLFTTQVWGITVVSSFGLFISGLLSFLLWGTYVAISILGIINASKGENKELPIIGKYAFYK